VHHTVPSSRVKLESVRLHPLCNVVATVTARRMSDTDRMHRTSDSVQWWQEINVHEVCHQLTHHDLLQQFRQYQQIGYGSIREGASGVESRPDFFITAVIDASLKPTEKWPDSMECLKSSATNGVMMSEMRFKVYIGIGSVAKHLSGNRHNVDDVIGRY